MTQRSQLTWTLVQFVLFYNHNYVFALDNLDSQLLGWTKKTFGVLYETQTSETLLKTDVVNCRFHDLEGQKNPRYMRCNQGKSCFNVVYIEYKNKSSNVVKQNQGCWPYFLTGKTKDNCSSSSCLFNNFDPEWRSNRTRLKSFFCCCTGSLCNNDINFKMKEVPEKATVGTMPTSPVLPVQAEEESNSSNSTLVLAMVVSSVTLGFIIGCLTLLYCWKHKHKNTATSQRLSKVLYHGRYLDVELNSQNISAQTLDNILHGNLIHQGCHSAIRLGHFEEKTVAVKVFPPRSKKQWRNEKAIYNMLGSHPNIAQFITCNQIQDDISFEGVIVMSYYTEGSLLNYLRHHTLTWKHMIRFAYSVVNGLAYLHGESDNRTGCTGRPGIAHRDLNSRNILVKSDGTCVLADFGFGLCLTGSPPENFPLVGSPRYMAPEVLDGSLVLSNWTSSMKQVDTYALGLVLWELARRCHEICEPDALVPECMLPYEEELGNGPSLHKVKHHVCSRKSRPNFPNQWRSNDFTLSYLSMMIQECWDQDGDARLTPLCVLNRLTQIQDVSSAEKLIYKETLEQDAGIYIGDDIEFYSEPSCAVLYINDETTDENEISQHLLKLNNSEEILYRVQCSK